MTYITKESALQAITDYQGGAVDKTVAKEIIEGLPEVPTMDDLISRQALINALLAEDYKEHQYCYPCKEVLLTIKAMPSAEPEPPWIPCNTRLPEKYGAYIVTDIDGDVEIAWYQQDWRDDKEIMAWYLDDYGWIEVLAWMPLPEAYKEDNNG